MKVAFCRILYLSQDNAEAAFFFGLFWFSVPGT